MATELDLSKPVISPTQAASLERVRSAARAELLATPSGRDFRVDAAILLATTLLFTLTAAAVTLLNGSWAVGSISQRGATLLLLALAQIAGAAAALSPRARAAQLASVALGAVAMAALVLTRGTGAPSLSPPWVCGASHLALALGPVAVALLLLRRSHLTPLKALSAGVAAGTVGATLGELACGRGALHVALFHVPAFLAAVLLVLLLSRSLRPLSFAD